MRFSVNFFCNSCDPKKLNKRTRTFYLQSRRNMNNEQLQIKFNVIKKRTIQRRIENPVKHLIWSILQKYWRLKAINYLDKTPHLRCLAEFLICLCSDPNLRDCQGFDSPEEIWVLPKDHFSDILFFSHDMWLLFVDLKKSFSI